MSNVVLMGRDAFCVSGGILWALNLDELEWRQLEVRDTAARIPLWENSSKDDLLLLTDEAKRLFLFVQFRPNLEDCEKVINYSYRVYPRGEEWRVAVPTRKAAGKGDPVSIPYQIVTGSLSDSKIRAHLRVANVESLKEGRRRVLYGVCERMQRALDEIGAGSVPYPASSEEF
ncbi:hypothetical protein PFISCL1PPCAC_2938, partial [Pristionchus fissidentatus]